MTGLEYLQGVVDGSIPHPSMAHTLGFRLTDVEEGRAVITAHASDQYCNPNGSIHGGWPAALLDSCMGSAVHSTLPAGTGFTVVEFKIDFVRPIAVDGGKVTAEGSVVNVGRRIGIADGILRDSRGRVVARGTTTCLILERGR
jgi:uncharacterized protein (TIGR00369 family)